MRLRKRLVKVATALAAKGHADQFHCLEIVALGDERAEGRTPGLYRVGSEGSLGGLLVYDPTQGEPVIPEGRLTPWAMVIRCHLPAEEPPKS
jgi:hypothetical protein